jgi:hypothetical protein
MLGYLQLIKNTLYVCIYIFFLTRMISGGITYKFTRTYFLYNAGRVHIFHKTFLSGITLVRPKKEQKPRINLS